MSMKHFHYCSSQSQVISGLFCWKGDDEGGVMKQVRDSRGCPTLSKWFIDGMGDSLTLTTIPCQRADSRSVARLNGWSWLMPGRAEGLSDTSTMNYPRRTEAGTRRLNNDNVIIPSSICNTNFRLSRTKDNLTATGADVRCSRGTEKRTGDRTAVPRDCSTASRRKPRVIPFTPFKKVPWALKLSSPFICTRPRRDEMSALWGDYVNRNDSFLRKLSCFISLHHNFSGTR